MARAMTRGTTSRVAVRPAGAGTTSATTTPPTTAHHTTGTTTRARVSADASAPSTASAPVRAMTTHTSRAAQIATVFGSGVVVPGTGFCLNNFLYWADVTKGSPNRVERGDAMPICVAPSIVTEGDKPVLALGTPGSYGILQTQPQAFVQYVDFGLPLQQAIEAPRARLTDGRAVLLESRVGAEVRQALRGRGHDLADGPDWTMKVGGMQGVALKDGTYTGGCDPRRDGYCVPA